MKKNTKIFIGVVAVAVVAYFLFFKKKGTATTVTPKNEAESTPIFGKDSYVIAQQISKENPHIEWTMDLEGNAFYINENGEKVIAQDYKPAK